MGHLQTGSQGQHGFMHSELVIHGQQRPDPKRKMHETIMMSEIGSGETGDCDHLVLCLMIWTILLNVVLHGPGVIL